MTWLVVLIVWLADAVPAPPTSAVALVLAGIFTVSSPLWLKAVPWTGAQMTAFTYLVALAIAVLAAYLTGTLSLTREGIVQALLDSGGVWTVQQLTYAALKQWNPASVGAAPTPVPAPPPAAPART